MEKKTPQKQKKPLENGIQQIVQLNAPTGVGLQTENGIGGLRTSTKALSEPLVDRQAYAKQVATPGTIQRLMNSVDARFGGDPLYRQHRADYQKIFSSTVQAIQKQDGTPYTTGEALRVVNDDLQNRRRNALEIQRQKRGLPSRPGPGNQFAPNGKLEAFSLPDFRKLDAGRLTLKELKENDSGTLTDVFNQARAASRENEETQPGLRATLAGRIRTSLGELQDYSKVFAHQGDKIVPELSPDAPGPLRMLANTGRQIVGAVNIPGALGGMTELGDTVEELASAANRGDHETISRIGHGLIGNDGWDATGNILGLFLAHKAPHVMSGAMRGATLEIVGRTKLGSAIRNAATDAHATAIVSKAMGLSGEHANNLAQAVREHFAEPPQVRQGNPVQAKSTLPTRSALIDRTTLKGAGLSHEQVFETQVGRAVKAGVATEKQAHVFLKKWRSAANEWTRRNRGATRDQFYEQFGPKMALDQAIPEGALHQGRNPIRVPVESRPSLELAPEIANLDLRKQTALRDYTLAYLKEHEHPLLKYLGDKFSAIPATGSFRGLISPSTVFEVSDNPKLARGFASFEGALGLQDAAVTMRASKKGPISVVRVFDPSGKAIAPHVLERLAHGVYHLLGADFTELSPEHGAIFGNFNGHPVDVFNRIMKDEALKEGLRTRAGAFEGDYIERSKANAEANKGESGVEGYEESLKGLGSRLGKSPGERVSLANNVDRYARAKASAAERVGGTSYSPGTGDKYAAAARFVKETLGLAQTEGGGVKGAVIFGEGTKPVMHLFTGTSHISTLLHESGHLWRRSLPASENALLSKAFGAKIGSVAFEERFARGLERYMYDGLAPSKATRPIFARFKGWMRDIYGDVKNGPLHEEVHPELRGVLDRMFGYDRPKPRPVLGRIPVAPTPDNRSNRTLGQAPNS